MSVMVVAPPKAEATYGRHYRVLICYERSNGDVIPLWVPLWRAYWHNHHGDHPEPQRFYRDRDQDGFTPTHARSRLRCAPNHRWIEKSVLADCNDWNASINPAAIEIPGNGKDDDCDSTTPDTVNGAPVVTSPGDQSSDLGDSLSLPILASDSDGDALTYSAFGLPPGASIDAATGQIMGTATSAGSYSVTVFVDDGNGGSGQASFVWTVDAPPPPNQAPVVTPIGDQSSDVGDSLSLPIFASDPDGDAISITVTGLPLGASFDLATQTIVGTATAAGTYSVTVTASDGILTGQETFVWTVDAPPPPNQAPVVTPIGDQSSDVGDSLSLPIFASDPDFDAISISVTGLPPGASFDQVTRTVVGTAATAGTYSVTVTAFDGILTGQETFVWTVNQPPPPVNVAPVIDPIADQTNTVGDSLSVKVTASDPNFDAISINVTGLPLGASFNLSNQTIEGTATAAGTYTVTVAVSDGILTTTETFTWVVS